MAGARGRQAVSGDVSMVTLMVNGYYDVELGAAGWSPYLGVASGWPSFRSMHRTRGGRVAG